MTDRGRHVVTLPVMPPGPYRVGSQPGAVFDTGATYTIRDAHDILIAVADSEVVAEAIRQLGSIQSPRARLRDALKEIERCATLSPALAEIARRALSEDRTIP